MILFPRHLIDPVDVHRVDRMSFGDGKVIGPSINLARAGKNNFDFGVVGAAGFENRKLRLAIDLQIRHGIAHRIEMTGLPGEVKEIVLALDQVAQTMGVADVGDIDLKPILEPFDVVKIAAVIRDQAVHDCDNGTKAVETPGKVRTNKAETTGNENARSFKLAFHG